jgi:putative hydrolase of the HAD superfamily
MPSQEIQAVIFDIGGVLVRTEDWSGRRKWEQARGLEEWALSTLVFDCEAALLASTGRGTDEAIWQQVAAQLHLTPEQAAALRSDFWAGDRRNEELCRFLHALRPRFKTGILSNAWSEMRDLNVQRFGLGDAVDHAVYSFQIGLLKPDPRAYAAVLQRLGVPAGEAVFVDDAERNIVGARAVGLHTVGYQNNAQTIQALTELLGLSSQDGI